MGIQVIQMTTIQRQFRDTLTAALLEEITRPSVRPFAPEANLPPGYLGYPGQSSLRAAFAWAVMQTPLAYLRYTNMRVIFMCVL